MANVRFIFDDGWINAAGLTATSEDASLPIENTQNEKRSKPWRSTSDVAQTITGVMPVSALQGGVVLSNTNLTMSADIDVALKNGVTTIDTITLECIAANVDGTTTWVGWFDVETEIDEISAVITDTANPDEYLQVVQIMCGPYITVEFNPGYGAEIDFPEAIRQLLTAGQSVRSEGTGAVRRTLSFSFDWVTAADRIVLRREMLRHGMRNPIFVSLYPEDGTELESDHQFVGKRMTSVSTRHHNPNLWAQVVEIREV